MLNNSGIILNLQFIDKIEGTNVTESMILTGPVHGPGQGLNSKFDVKFPEKRTWSDTIIKQVTTTTTIKPF